MSDRFERFSAVAGVLAVVLWAAGVAIIGGGHVGLPGGIPEEGADEILAHLRANEDAVVAGGWLFMLGSLAFLWFVGVLRSRLAAAEGGTTTFAPAGSPSTSTTRKMRASDSRTRHVALHGKQQSMLSRPDEDLIRLGRH